MYRADLHCHSTHSDGTLSPAQILDCAKEKELSAISITDHDTIDAYTVENYKKAAEVNVRLLPGVEFSARYEQYPIHILGYAFEISSDLRTFCRLHQERRMERNRMILHKLRSKGYLIDEEELTRLNTGKTIGRPHIAQLMVKKHYVSSIQEAFNLYLGEGKRCFEAGAAATPQETIEVIHAAAGKAVIAHPHLIEQPHVLQQVLDMNFDGLECYYGLFHHGQEKRWLNIARSKRWLISGGSDFHGAIKPNIQLGCSWVSKGHVAEIFGEQ